MRPRIAALVPMRHNSERVPGKNIRMFAGRMLYHHIIGSLLRTELIDEIVIDTDSPTILKDSAETFPEVNLIERPENLRGGRVPMNDILLYDVTQVESDYYLQTHCTNPLVKENTIIRAVESFLEKIPACDSLFSVTKLQKRLWNDQGEPVNHDPAVLKRTQDLPPVYEENSCIYIFSREVLETRGTRIGFKPYMFEMDPAEAWDIDNELDFRICEMLYLQKRQ